MGAGADQEELGAGQSDVVVGADQSEVVDVGATQTDVDVSEGGHGTGTAWAAKAERRAAETASLKCMVMRRWRE